MGFCIALIPVRESEGLEREEAREVPVRVLWGSSSRARHKPR